MANHDFSSKVENLKDYPINFATEAKTEFGKTHKVYNRVISANLHRIYIPNHSEINMIWTLE